jgi:hypothetical protein
VRLSAAESSGVLRIVSSPRILTLDNTEASIAQGTLIPFSQVSAAGVQTAFQEAKLQLRVRPHVTADGYVSIHVRVTRDEPDFNNTGARGDPTILKREAETDLFIQDGRTAVIGGIYTRNTGRNVEQVPFFGDIPILGAALPAPPHHRPPLRDADLHHASDRQPRRVPRPLTAPTATRQGPSSPRRSGWGRGAFARFPPPRLELRRRGDASVQKSRTARA